VTPAALTRVALANAAAAARESLARQGREQTARRLEAARSHAILASLDDAAKAATRVSQVAHSD